MKYIIAMILLVGMIIPAFAESQYGDCTKEVFREVQRAQWVSYTLYDCTYQGFDISISQHGLTLQEVELLDSIKESRQNGTYIMPPIQTSEIVEVEIQVSPGMHASQALTEEDFERTQQSALDAICEQEYYRTNTKLALGCVMTETGAIVSP